ncbi:hypothetical protein AGMMS4956_14280 [Bacteroidia bacterium]|nr:hypothetical protein AGMMS4956_14280 [Bacteroidia bacterium]
MRKQLYNFISDLLRAIDGEPVKHIDIWNNQIAFIEDEQPFATPAVFIEFAPIRWNFVGGTTYEADITFTLHVVTDSRVKRWSDVILVFDLLDVIHSVLHGAQLENTSQIIRTASTTDNLFGELMHNQETYTLHAISE